MAQTRSKRSLVTEERAKEEEYVDTGTVPDVGDDKELRPSTFNGKLTKFKHTTTTTSTSSSPAASSVRTLLRSRKRVQEDELNVSSQLLMPASPSSTSSPRPTKKRKASGYAPPSKYAHLSPLIDILAPNLICVFVGTNPGVQTATAGHAYAHPSNHFWKLLHSSGLTDRRLRPEEDRSLPEKYCMGNTNIVDRPSRDAAELTKAEMTAGTKALDEKFRKYKPEAVCIVGKGIWEAIWRYRHGRNIKPAEFRYGWQDESENMGKTGVWGEKEVDAEGKAWKGAKVFVTTSTSGLAAHLKPKEKEEIWRPFGEWVQKRRVERGFVPS